jgi:hypothetical protein
LLRLIRLRVVVLFAAAQRKRRCQRQHSEENKPAIASHFASSFPSSWIESQDQNT